MAELIKIYRVEQDNFTGKLARSMAFAPAEFHRLMEGSTGLVAADVMDGGCAGAILAPEGSTFGETASGEAVLVVPGHSTGFSADDAWKAATLREQGFRFPD